jgi:hypothetical protein
MDFTQQQERGEEIMFTKRHYERIAKKFAAEKIAGNTESAMMVNEARADIAKELADMFAEDNPRFNREMFLKACEVK